MALDDSATEILNLIMQKAKYHGESKHRLALTP